MSRHIGVAKVARMMGIKRTELNKRLLAAEIPTFEGEVDLDQVRTIAPNLSRQDHMLERVRYIRENTTKMSADEEQLLHEDELREQVHRLSTHLMIEERRAEHLELILRDILDKLGQLQHSNDVAERSLAMRLSQWLMGRLS